MSVDPSSSRNLEHLKKSAKHLLRACRAGDAEAIARLQAALGGMSALSSEQVAAAIRLADVHQAIAREHGLASWADLVRFDDPLARLLAAVRGGHLQTIRQHLQEFAPLVHVSIHAACALGNAGAVARHLEGDASVASRPLDGWMPFAYVCASPLPRLSARHMTSLATCAKLLLDAGADAAEAVSGDGVVSTEPVPPAFRAIMSGNMALLGLLGQRGLALPTDYLQRWVSAPKPADETVPHQVFSEYFKRPDVRARFRARMEAAKNAPPASRNPLAATFSALSDPLERQQLQMQNLIGAKADLWEALLDRGYDPNRLSSVGRSALHGVVEYGPPDAIEMFLARGADPSARDSSGRSVFVTAVRAGNLAAAELLLSKGVEDDASDVDRLVGACLAGDRERAFALVDAQPELPASLTREDAESLVRAAGRGNADQVRLFLDVGLDPDLHGESGATALHQASWRGQVQVVELLVERGAKADAKDDLYRQTAIEWALDGADHAEGARENCLRVAAILNAG